MSTVKRTTAGAVAVLVAVGAVLAWPQAASAAPKDKAAVVDLVSGARR